MGSSRHGMHAFIRASCGPSWGKERDTPFSHKTYGKRTADGALYLEPAATIQYRSIGWKWIKTEQEIRVDLEALRKSPWTVPLYSNFTKHQKTYSLLDRICRSFSPAVSKCLLSDSQYFGSGFKGLWYTHHLDLDELYTHMIFHALAPTVVFGDLAKISGTRPAYILGFEIYVMRANIGLEVQNMIVSPCGPWDVDEVSEAAALSHWRLVCRCRHLHKRRKVHGLRSTLDPMIGPAIAPILGAILTDYLGWRSIFWFLNILPLQYT